MPPPPPRPTRPPALPLAGLRVVEFTHMVMGPTCGMVLADLGAEVIKVEPIEGDSTRHLLGRGRRLLPDVQPQQEEHRDRPAQSPKGRRGLRKLAASADVVSENFKPGTMGKYGLDYAALSRLNPRLIYVSATRASCPAPTSTARRWTRWCR
jgi:crotonobetainyl-CoA:carnitine CoA-transferase CaiB-like acyl-CoA transferase